MKRYILFDLDGTLTDPKLGICTCVQYALHAYGIEEPDLDNLECFIGPPLIDSFMQFYDFTEEQAKGAVAKYRERFQDVGLFENELYPGIDTMLKRLSGAGFQLAVASSKPTVYVERILEHFHIRSFFKVVVGSELSGERSKKEEVIAEALRQLFPYGEIAYDEVYMVGDRCFDIEGAKTFSIESIGVTYGYGGLEELKNSKADYIVESVPELQELIFRELADLPKKTTLQIFLPMLEALLVFVLVKFAVGAVLLLGWGKLCGISQRSLYEKIFVMTEDTDAVLYGTIYCMTVLLGFLAAGGAIRKDARKQIYRQFRVTRLRHLRRKPGYLYVLGILVGIAAVFGGNALLIASRLTEHSQAYSEAAQMPFAALPAVSFLCYGLVSPIAEELLFRGVFFTRARRHFPFGIAAFSSAFAFAVYHLNLVQGLYGFLLGFLMCYFYEYYGSFFWPVLLHVMANLIALLCGRGQLTETFLFKWHGFLLMTGICLAGIGWMQRVRRKL